MSTNEDGVLRWQLQALRHDLEPGADLWPGIAARIAATPRSAAPGTVRSARRLLPLAMAASVLLAIGMVWHMTPVAGDDEPDGMASVRKQAVSMTLDYEGALARLQQAGTHPEMHGAFVELDRSATQILSAIDRDPGATFLLEQLRRTYARRLQLTQRAIMT